MSFMRKFGKSRESSFWRQLAAAESIDVDGATIRSSSGSRQGLEICRQLVWIVEKRIEVSSFYHGCAGVVCWICADRRCPFVLDRSYARNTSCLLVGLGLHGVRRRCTWPGVF